jgi:hypothetical protein
MGRAGHRTWLVVYKENLVNRNEAVHGTTTLKQENERDALRPKEEKSPSA